jgi:hypothetical protein
MEIREEKSYGREKLSKKFSNRIAIWLAHYLAQDANSVRTIRIWLGHLLMTSYQLLARLMSFPFYPSTIYVTDVVRMNNF